MTSIKEAVKFHGHLGPYLILGLLAGDLILKKLNCKKYFGLKVEVYGANKRPKSCLIDGLQLATGATYGKGNINKHPAKQIKITSFNTEGGRRIALTLNKTLLKKLELLESHAESERFAKKLLGLKDQALFDLK